MKIAVIGTGNVGAALALAFSKAAHQVVFGVRDATAHFKGKEFSEINNIPALNIADAVAQSDVIVISVPGQVAHEAAKQLGDVSEKVIIDTMNAVFIKPAHYSNTTEAILDNSNTKDIVKCFNTTGYENMGNPNYNGVAIDMFVAGDSAKAKLVATQLAKDIGFGEVYDFGGNDKINLIEQFALSWINLAIIQKQGRGIAFKVLKR
jgi:predicted dinucleotide-binding enzyme